ncbi:hypothetical protein K491DRAFT_721768 [Lophiostoma macrostomum CBS 122681]|uniref:Uncharacterized protein n=1 Tax=Lophiostoma macrostomum CBS 122681 TaxID=1314788 RepID=A0A6A6SQQ6_9PLEO|nr:hypothetical protein K491DRAFT_721768 [Lophiostoma macrostomum CBS 122681]
MSSKSFGFPPNSSSSNVGFDGLNSLPAYQMSPLEPSPREGMRTSDLNTDPCPLPASQDIEKANQSPRKASFFSRLSIPNIVSKRDGHVRLREHENSTSDEDDLSEKTDGGPDSTVIVKTSVPNPTSAPASLKRPQNRRSSILEAFGSAIRSKMTRTRKDSSMCTTPASSRSSRTEDMTTAGLQSIQGQCSDGYISSMDAAFELAAVEGRLRLSPSSEDRLDGSSNYWRRKSYRLSVPSSFKRRAPGSGSPGPDDIEYYEWCPCTPTPETNSDAGLRRKESHRWGSLRNWSPAPAQRRMHPRQFSSISRGRRKISKGKQAVPRQPPSCPSSVDGFTVVDHPKRTGIAIKDDVPSSPKDLGVLPCTDSVSVRNIPMATFSPAPGTPLKPLTRIHDNTPCHESAISEQPYSCSSSLIALHPHSPSQPPRSLSPLAEPADHDSSASDASWDAFDLAATEPFELTLAAYRFGLSSFYSSPEHHVEPESSSPPQHPGLVVEPARPDLLQPELHLVKDADARSTISQRTGIDHDLHTEGLQLTRMDARANDGVPDMIYLHGFGDAS